MGRVAVTYSHVLRPGYGQIAVCGEGRPRQVASEPKYATCPVCSGSQQGGSR